MLALHDERLDSDVARPLVAALIADMEARYGGEEADDGLRPSDLVLPAGRFLVATVGGCGRGCGGLRRRDDGTAELKRMWVAPDARRLGVGWALLQELERTAVELGFDRVVLETGARQPEALALYERAGYVRIPAYGTYEDSPESVCFAKGLR